MDCPTCPHTHFARLSKSLSDYETSVQKQLRTRGVCLSVCEREKPWVFSFTPSPTGILTNRLGIWSCFPINCTRTLTCKYNGVQAGFPPQLHEMHHVPKPKRGMTGEDNTWLLKVIAEVSVDAGVMLQFVGLDELESWKMFDICFINCFL